MVEGKVENAKPSSRTSALYGQCMVIISTTVFAFHSGQRLQSFRLGKIAMSLPMFTFMRG